MGEIPCETLRDTYGWDIPRRYDGLLDLDSVTAAAKRLNPVVQEGFVVVDKDWKRIKVKSAAYVALHHIGGNLDRGGVGGATKAPLRRRRLLEIARNNEGSEFLAYYPSLADEYGGLRSRLCALRDFLERDETVGDAIVLAGGGDAVMEVAGFKLKNLRAACAGIKRTMVGVGDDVPMAAAEAIADASIRDIESLVDCIGGAWSMMPGGAGGEGTGEGKDGDGRVGGDADADEEEKGEKDEEEGEEEEEEDDEVVPKQSGFGALRQMSWSDSDEDDDDDNNDDDAEERD